MNCTGSIHKGIYNCYGKVDESQCYDCIHNSDSTVEKKQDKFLSTKEKFDVLYDYLKGIRLPTGVTCKMPKLSADVAFSLIWFLQEIMHCLPDNIEQCDGCKMLFDSDSAGYYLDDQYELDGKTLPKKYWGHWCDECVPDVDFEC